MPTGFKGIFAGAVIIVVVMPALLAGCGGSSSSANSSSEPSSEFLRPTGKNKTAKFGEEADEAEREAASKVLEENLQARASGAWAKQCSSLSARGIQEFEKEALGAGDEGCVKSVEFLARVPEPNKTKAIRANTMTGPIDALRVKRNEGFALYHGTKGKDYAMKMEKEGGEWKVASLTTEELP